MFRTLRLSSLFAALIFSCGIVWGDELFFTKKGVWCEIATRAYRARVSTSGNIIFNVKNTMLISADFFQMWNKRQAFPHVTQVKASCEEYRKQHKIVLKLNYFWNDGRVNETLTFTPRSIAGKYVYTPDIKKDTKRIRCIFSVRRPKKQPEQLELIGMDRSIVAHGNLLKLGKWKQVKKPEMRMISIRNAGKYTIDLLAAGNAWLSLLKWPRLSLCDNGNYPRFDKTVYMPGESKTMKYAIEISEPDGREIPDNPLVFKSLQGRKR